MPCFSTGPDPGTPAYDAWLPEVRRRLDSFTHVVDYYYRKAGMGMPEPTTPDSRDVHPDTRIIPSSSGADLAENARVLHQILLHLDCDDVDVFHLNDIRNLLWQDRTPRGQGYLDVLQHCFSALRKGFRDRPTTGAMWMECRDPALMLDHLRGRVSGRKLRLFAVACCQRVPHLLADKRSSAAVEVSERYAEGLATEEELAAAKKKAERAWSRREECDSPSAWAAAASAEEAARNAAWNAFCDRDGMGEELIQSALLRCIAGNPFHTVKFDPAWLTPAAVGVAQQVYESRDFSALPILADALEDAGCDNVDILDHLRSPGPHVRGCWPLDLLLDKE